MPSRLGANKIVFCAYDWADNNSGPSTWMANLLPSLREKNCDVRVLLQYWDTPGPLFQSLNEQNIPIDLVHCNGFTEERVHWILRKVLEHSPDIFVPNLVTPALLSSQYVRKWGIPTVGVLHSDDRFYRAVADRFVYGRTRDSLSVAVCVSQHIEQAFFGRPNQRTMIRRIPYGVSVPTYTPTRRSRKTFRIAYVGRIIEEQKRITDVVRAMCLVTERIPGTEAVLFGDGPDKAKVEAIINVAGANGRVKLHGRVDNSKLNSELKEFDAILLLSDYEGLPIALLEGMANALVPIVINMESGIPELIQDNINGIIVGDRGEAVVEAVQMLINQPEQSIRLASAARQTIATNFTFDRSAELWGNLLLELGNNRNRNLNNRLPKKLNLPKVHPDLSQEDPRKPNVTKFSRALIFLGRIRAKLFHSKPSKG